MTTTPSQSRNCYKSVPSGPPCPSKLETVRNQFLQDHHTLPKWKLLKSVISRPPHPPKLETLKNQFFHDHHTLPNWKLLKISYFKTTTPSQIRNLKISSFKTVMPIQIRNCSKSVLLRPPHHLKVETAKNQFLQDRHAHPK